ncbi:MAG TPA: DUF2304 domain-containing protein [Acidimicrobiia bacterium]|nr:DUF2304 domain-containing protein [Acidimicrobiia bacterium]
MIAQTEAPSLGLSGPAHVVAIIVVLIGAWYLLRMLRQRQLRGKYTMLWMSVGAVVLVLAVFPSLLDRVADLVDIYSPPNLLFMLAIGFLLLVCIYFSWELSRLEEKTRVLAEEVAILRGEQEQHEPA